MNCLENPYAYTIFRSKKLSIKIQLPFGTKRYNELYDMHRICINVLLWCLNKSWEQFAVRYNKYSYFIWISLLFKLWTSGSILPLMRRQKGVNSHYFYCLLKYNTLLKFKIRRILPFLETTPWGQSQQRTRIITIFKV